MGRGSVDEMSSAAHAGLQNRGPWCMQRQQSTCSRQLSFWTWTKPGLLRNVWKYAFCTHCVEVKRPVMGCTGGKVGVSWGGSSPGEFGLAWLWEAPALSSVPSQHRHSPPFIIIIIFFCTDPSKLTVENWSKPELTLCDFSLWSQLKSGVCLNQLITITDFPLSVFAR